MRVSLINQPQIETLSSALKQALATLVASIQVGWSEQHNGDGGHTSVTAASLTVAPGVTVLNKVNLASVTYIEPTIGPGIRNDLTMTGLSGVSCLRIVATASPLMITGIDATGRQRGDLLLVLNCDEWLAAKDLQLLGEDVRSAPENRFCDTAASTGGIGSIVTVQGARGVWLMYDFQDRILTGGAAAIGPRWRIINATP